ncbi:MAG: hypothetical protein EZS28_021659, partial [Streblomastix strix]
MIIAFVFGISWLCSFTFCSSSKTQYQNDVDASWGLCTFSTEEYDNVYVNGEIGNDNIDCGIDFDNSCETIQYTLCTYAQNILSITIHLQQCLGFVEERLEFTRMNRKYIIDGEDGRSLIKHSDYNGINFIHIQNSDVTIQSCYVQLEDEELSNLDGQIIRMESGTLTLNQKDFQVILVVAGIINLDDVRFFYINSESKPLIEIQSGCEQANLKRLRFQGVKLKGTTSNCISIDVSDSLQCNLALAQFFDIEVPSDLIGSVGDSVAPMKVILGPSTTNSKQSSLKQINSDQTLS